MVHSDEVNFNTTSEVFNIYLSQNKEYFNDLEELGPVNKYVENIINKIREDKACKVGAKPLSGIRGIYFSKGSWRVKYFNDEAEVITCFFNYTDHDTLIAGFNAAYYFLEKVIEYGRHTKNEDGIVLERLNKHQLIELDKRKGRKDKNLLSPKVYNINRRLDKYHSYDDYDDQRAKRKEQAATLKTRKKPANNTQRIKKQSYLEAKFDTYSTTSTSALINDMIQSGVNKMSEINESTDGYLSQGSSNVNLTDSSCHRSTKTPSNEVGYKRSHIDTDDSSDGLLNLIKLYKFDYCFKKK